MKFVRSSTVRAAFWTMQLPGTTEHVHRMGTPMIHQKPAFAQSRALRHGRRLWGWTATAAVAILVVGAGTAHAATSPARHSAATSVAPPGLQTDWLGEINRYRDAAGETPVTNNPSWDAGILAHLNYLQSTPLSYRTGQYASAHTENPASPYYTAAGAQEGASSDLITGETTLLTPVQAIDGWWTAPFHAIGMLRPGLTQVALGIGNGGAGLDVISGLEYGQTPQETTPVLFPGPGITTNLLQYGGESPDPLETCGWQNLSQPVGLPLIVLLPTTPQRDATATLTSSSGTLSTANGTLCLVVYGPTGLSILQGDQAVLLIPKHPLASGVNTPTLNEPGSAPITWSFTAVPPVPVKQSLPTIAGRGAVGVTVRVHHGEWSNTPTSYHDQWELCRRGRCKAADRHRGCGRGIARGRDSHQRRWDQHQQLVRIAACD
jgi:hypothetical protein